MAAATQDRIIRTKWTGRTFAGKVAAATIIYAGTLVAKNAAGNIVPASDTAALKVVGYSLEKVDNSDGAAGDLKVQIQEGVIELDNAGGAIVQASQHGLCYVADDQSVTTAAVAANDIVAGIVDDFTATKVWVRVGPEYGALT